MSETAGSLGQEDWIAVGQVEAVAGGGDCARVVSHRNGQALFFVADVSGHDSRAARFARQLDVVSLHFAGATSPGILLSILNATLAESWPADMFASAVCFSLDPDTGEGVIAVAGQFPPVVKGPGSSSPLNVDGGPPLGVFAEHCYSERTFTLAAGDLLVLATDGVTDPLATRQDLLGLSAFGRLVDRAPADPAEMCAALLGSARRAGLRDDATVLAVAPAFRLETGGDAMKSKIPVPFDFSESSEAALAWAADLQRTAGAGPIQIAHAINSQPLGNAEISLDPMLPSEEEIAGLE